MESELVKKTIGYQGVKWQYKGGRMNGSLGSGKVSQWKWNIR